MTYESKFGRLGPTHDTPIFPFVKKCASVATSLRALLSATISNVADIYVSERNAVVILSAYFMWYSLKTSVWCTVFTCVPLLRAVMIHLDCRLAVVPLRD